MENENIYIQSLIYFNELPMGGSSFSDYKIHIKKHFQDTNDGDLERLYRQITETGHLTFQEIDKWRHIASLRSMLGLLEYQELQHSLQESKDAKIQAIISTKIAYLGIFLAVIGLIITIYFSNKQINLSIEQFEKANSTKKDTVHYIEIRSPILKPLK